jgi:D-sedoheptulose 7-phosphate isomerase
MSANEDLVGQVLHEVARATTAISQADLHHLIATLRGIANANRRLFVLGNGGSASTATHTVCDLMKVGHDEGRFRIRAFALTDNTALLTAISNDCHFQDAFRGQIKLLTEPGDMVLAFSTSGISPNVVDALRAARCHGCLTAVMLGASGGEPNLADIVLRVDSLDAGVIESVHLAVVHAIAAALRVTTWPSHEVCGG